MINFERRARIEEMRRKAGEDLLDVGIARRGNGGWTTAPAVPAEIISVVASEVAMRPIDWLWPGRIPRGKLTLIAGHPGVGKSQISCSLASIASNGGEWPVDRTPCAPGSVIILSAEDDPEDTLVPRLCAAEARTDRCHLIRCVRDRDINDNPGNRMFSLLADVQRLGEKAEAIGDVNLIIIDPVSAYLGATDGWRNTAVRAALAPVAAMAAEIAAAIVLISHLNKGGGQPGQGALMRVMDSLAFTAAPRSAYLCCKDQEDPARRLFLPMKVNLGPEMPGLSYQIHGITLDNDIATSRVIWGDKPIDTTADEAIAPVAAEGQSMHRDALSFVAEALANGPAWAEDLRKRAHAEEIGWRTVHRAADELKVIKRKPYGQNKYQWTLPSAITE